MTFLSYSIGEWATLLAIGGSVISAIVWVVKVTILNTFYDKLDDQNVEAKSRNDLLASQMQTLSDAINRLNNGADRDHRENEQRFDKVENQLGAHDQQIKTLFNHIGD